MGFDQGPQFRQDVRGAARRQVCVDAQLERGQVLFLQRQPQLGKGVSRQVAQRISAPQLQSLTQQHRRPFGRVLLQGGPAEPYERGEAADVQRLRAGLDQVAAGVGAYGSGIRGAAERAAQTQHVVLEGVVGAERRRIAPQAMDQGVHGHHPVGLDQQRCQQHPQLGGVDVYRCAGLPDHQRSEDPEFVCASHCSPVGPSPGHPTVYNGA
jgi:hypothetical protein